MSGFVRQLVPELHGISDDIERRMACRRSVTRLEVLFGCYGRYACEIGVPCHLTPELIGGDMFTKITLVAKNRLEMVSIRIVEGSYAFG
jgi:hypothetical protein